MLNNVFKMRRSPEDKNFEFPTAPSRPLTRGVSGVSFGHPKGHLLLILDTLI